MKWINQFRAMQHILNTGQGVVMEGCANADYCHLNAAYQAGWIQDEMKSLYEILTKNTLFHVNRPNLIVYLDAPVDVVRKIILLKISCFFERKVNGNFLILFPIYKSDVTTDFEVNVNGLLIIYFDFGHKNMIGRYLLGI